MIYRGRLVGFAAASFNTPIFGQWLARVQVPQLTGTATTAMPYALGGLLLEFVFTLGTDELNAQLAANPLEVLVAAINNDPSDLVCLAGVFPPSTAWTPPGPGP